MEVHNGSTAGYLLISCKNKRVLLSKAIWPFDIKISNFDRFFLFRYKRDEKWWSAEKK
jgi:hypothetical protein